MVQDNNISVMPLEKSPRAVCSVHGDIGQAWQGSEESAPLVVFTLKDQGGVDESYCLLCWRNFLRLHLMPVEYVHARA